MNDQPDQQPDATPVIDTELIQRYEDELADVARTLEAVERIVASGADPATTVRQLDGLVEDGRFAVEQPVAE